MKPLTCHDAPRSEYSAAPDVHCDPLDLLTFVVSYVRTQADAAGTTVLDRFLDTHTELTATERAWLQERRTIV